MSDEYSHFAGRSIFGIGLLGSAAKASSRKCSYDEDSSKLMLSDEFSGSSWTTSRTRAVELNLWSDDSRSASGSRSLSGTAARSDSAGTRSGSIGAPSSIIRADPASDASAVPASIGRAFVDVVDVVDVDHLESSDPWTCSSRTVGSMPADDTSTIEDLETVATADSDLEEDPIEAKVEPAVPESKPKVAPETSSKKSKSKAKKARQKKLNEKLHKTELCKMFMKDKKCRFGKACAYAHGESELKTAPPKHPKYKSIPCKNLKKKGFCPFGDKCVFIH